MRKWTKILVGSFLFTASFSFSFESSSAADHVPVALIASGKVIEEAVKLHDDKKYAEAIEKYLTISRNDTNYAWSLTELTFSYLANGDTLKAISTIKSGLELHSEYQLAFYELLGDAYDNTKTFDKSIEAYKEGLKQYPYYFKYYFEMGIVYARHDNDSAAMQCFQKAIRMNPLHASSHLQLGYLAARNNKFTQAILSLQMFLVLENTSKRSASALSLIERIGEGNYKANSPDSVIDISKGNDHFEEIEEIIRSKSALTEKYKTNIKLSFQNVIKTMQVLNEKLRYDKSDKGFWMQTYVPFFTELWKSGYFEPFMYNSFASLDDDKVRKEISSNKSKIDKYVDWASTYLTEQFPREPLTVNGNNYQLTSRYNNNYHPVSIGHYDSKLKLTLGQWIYFYATGTLKSMGMYDNKGIITGEWKFYYSDGPLRRIVKYQDGKLSGPFESFYKNGQTKEKGTYKNDLNEGDLKRWYATGVLNYDIAYKDGKEDGPLKIYYETGVLKKEAVLKNDLYEGPYKEYSRNGNLKIEMTYINGKKTGRYKSYYQNGMLEREGNLINGDEDGEWKYYFESGKLQKRGSFKAGKETGVWKEFNEENGNTESETIYTGTGGKGVYKEYDEDGIQFSEMQYDKSLKKYKYMDKAGKIVSQGEVKGGVLDFVAYDPAGKIKKIEGKFVNGKEEGMWIHYHSTGQKQNEIAYKDGKKDGEGRFYYKNGKLKEKLTYKEGNKDGYYTSYFLNGNIDQEGWYINDEGEGDWIDYHANGAVSRKRFFHEDVSTGYTVNYDELGRKQYEEYDDENDLLASVCGYDTSGNELFRQSLVKGSGEFTSLHLNKKQDQHAFYKNGKRDGEVVFNYANGQKHIVEHFDKGRLFGAFTRYYEDGKTDEEAYYKVGEQDSISKSYYHTGALYSQHLYHNGNARGHAFWNFDNGKLFEEGQFKNDDRDGYFIYYANDGVTVRMRVKYKEGDILSYSYLDKSGNYVPEIPLKNQSGTIIAYYSNGNKSAELTFVNGYDDGPRTLYFTNGKVETEDVYKDDRLEGISKDYYENGKLKSEDNYYFGYLNGLSKSYTDKGILKKQATYVLGSKEGLTNYYDEITGKLKKKVKYVNNEPYE